MQIKIQLNDSASEFSENVVQKVLTASNARQNEMHREWMYIQVSSISSYRKTTVQRNRKHHKWSLCSIDKFYSNYTFLIKYLLLNSSFLLLLTNYGRTGGMFHRWFMWHMWKSPALFYTLQLLNAHMPMIETTHKCLMSDKSFIQFLHSALHTLKASSLVSVNFYTKFYKILLNSFYESHFNSRHFWYQPQHQHALNPHSINTFCDLSTNSKILLFLFNAIVSNNNSNNNNNNYNYNDGADGDWCCSRRKQQINYYHYYYHHHFCGIEHHRYVVKSFTSSLTTDKLRALQFFYRILLIQCHLICNKYEFRENNVKHQQQQLQQQKHLLAHNQHLLHIVIMSIRWHYKSDKYCCANNKPSDDCHSTLGIENGIATFSSTSNHKLKVSQNDNDTCHHHHHHHHHDHHRHHHSGYQHLHRPTFRSNDSVKSHLNAILFFIILCIPLLTAATSVHNLKYSTNVVKTKYGPLRGIVLRQNPTVEGYLGVPYGKLSSFKSPFLSFRTLFIPSDFSHSFTFSFSFLIPFSPLRQR
jgi:hypothetical protein